ncbi:hypothetical protein [Pyxidicoccus xibeiensis]|uniref:hypothetical protein n=1 Tax=Pyxidicoccus xibeiensis TaxID=2906759 RepID=UPI0020A7C5AD|nr:hypothetical protein [Pyxidicoccus xibeiensis]MCP3143116.1 hypothetical protein [Pyxidicoccus xibeiensis]
MRPRRPRRPAIFEANCLKEAPARIADRVLKEREPCHVSARVGHQGVLVPFEERYLPVLESHPRVMDALLKDLKKPGTDMAMYCMQVGLTNEQDAFRFLDARERPVLALVGLKRFQRWEKAHATAKPAGKKAASKKSASKKAASKKSASKKPASKKPASRSATKTARASAPKRKTGAPAARRRTPRSR